MNTQIYVFQIKDGNGNIIKPTLKEKLDDYCQRKGIPSTIIDANKNMQERKDYDLPQLIWFIGTEDDYTVWRKDFDLEQYVKDHSQVLGMSKAFLAVRFYGVVDAIDKASHDAYMDAIDDLDIAENDFLENLGDITKVNISQKTKDTLKFIFDQLPDRAKEGIKRTLQKYSRFEPNSPLTVAMKGLY